MTKLILTILLGFGYTSFAISTKDFKSVYKKSANFDKINKGNKYVFAFYWATWCVNCKKKLRTKIPKLKKKFPNVTFVAINIDKDKRRVEKFIEKYKIGTVPHFYNSKLITKHNINKAPYWSILKINESKKVSVVKKKLGFNEKEVKKLLKKATKSS